MLRGVGRGKKYKSGYSFRSQDFSEGDTFKKRRGNKQETRSQGNTVPFPGGEQGEQRECAQGEWCHAATRDADGTWHPALTFQAFCPACRGRIATCLGAFPYATVRLLAQIGERPRTGKAVRVPPGPRTLIRLDVDALVRELAATLGSWHERVAAVADLTPPETLNAAGQPIAASHPAEVIRDATAVLSAHLDVLLALPPEPVARVFLSPADAEAQADGLIPGRPWSAPGEDGVVFTSGEAHMSPPLSGIHAGKEILDLHRRAVALLGETRGRPDTFDGLPCRRCEAMSLERAEPPSDPKIPAMHARCSQCGDTMNKDTFDAWARTYGQWAESAVGLVCRRCQNGDHAICQWQACPCRNAGHAGIT